MKTRAAEIGAQLEWTSRDSGGTTVTLLFDPRTDDRRARRSRRGGSRLT